MVSLKWNEMGLKLMEEGIDCYKKKILLIKMIFIKWIC